MTIEQNNYKKITKQDFLIIARIIREYGWAKVDLYANLNLKNDDEANSLTLKKHDYFTLKAIISKNFKSETEFALWWNHMKKIIKIKKIKEI